MSKLLILVVVFIIGGCLALYLVLASKRPARGSVSTPTRYHADCYSGGEMIWSADDVKDWNHYSAGITVYWLAGRKYPVTIAGADCIIAREDAY